MIGLGVSEKALSGAAIRIIKELLRQQQIRMEHNSQIHTERMTTMTFIPMMEIMSTLMISTERRLKKALDMTVVKVMHR